MTRRFLRSRKTVPTAAAFLFATASCAVVAQAPNQESTVVVKLRVLHQDGPIQILGLRFPEESEKEPSVHLRNTSERRTKAIWTEAIISNENGHQPVKLLIVPAHHEGRGTDTTWTIPRFTGVSAGSGQTSL